MSKNILITILILIVSTIIFETTSLDIKFQDFFFNHEFSKWIIDRDDSFLKLILYSGIKKVFICFVISLIVLITFFKKKQFVQKNKKGIKTLILSCLIVPLTINGLKAITNIPCPRDLTLYGGKYPHVTIFKEYPKDFFQEKRIRCFPAGHASGGFALMSLYFFFKKRRNKIIALSLATASAWIIGSYKMLIGDHFLSHTVFSMLLSWLIILIIVNRLEKT